MTVSGLKRFIFMSAVTLVGCVASGPMQSSSEPKAVQEIDFTLPAADGRSVPARAFMPAEDCSPCDLIIFSHGANATYDRYDVVARTWAEQGYVVAAPQHVDSEEHRNRSAYSMDDSRPTRLEDYALISEAFASDAPPVSEMSYSGVQYAAGHSYGALIAQVAGGAVLADPDWRLPATLTKPAAVIALSPPGEMDGLITAEGFSTINVPMLVVTGTADRLPGFIDNWEQHLEGYDLADPNLSYALVFEDMDHNFNGAYCRITPEGIKARPSVDVLNTRILGFLKDVRIGELPSRKDWTRSDNGLVRALKR